MNSIMVRQVLLVTLLLIGSSGATASQTVSKSSMQTATNQIDSLRFDFGSQMPTNNWISVLDQVMGGRSTGEITMHRTHISYAGKVSLENNGGFASLRSPVADYDLSNFQSMTIRYRAVGQHFALTLNQHSQFFKPRYKAVLASSDGQWHTETIGFEAFAKVRLGERLSGQLTRDELASTIRIGLISNDKFASDFELDVDYIEFK